MVADQLLACQAGANPRNSPAAPLLERDLPLSARRLRWQNSGTRFSDRLRSSFSLPLAPAAPASQPCCRTVASNNPTSLAKCPSFRETRDASDHPRLRHQIVDLFDAALPHALTQQDRRSDSRWVPRSLTVILQNGRILFRTIRAWRSFREVTKSPSRPP